MWERAPDTFNLLSPGNASARYSRIRSDNARSESRSRRARASSRQKALGARGGSWRGLSQQPRDFVARTFSLPSLNMIAAPCDGVGPESCRWRQISAPQPFPGRDHVDLIALGEINGAVVDQTVARSNLRSLVAA
jgi:hypothetical protein